jgi:hypothetical protein
MCSTSMTILTSEVDGGALYTATTTDDAEPLPVPSMLRGKRDGNQGGAPLQSTSPMPVASCPSTST